MKALKITLIVAVLITAFTSCTKQDLNDDVLLNQELHSTYYTGGDVDD